MTISIYGLTTVIGLIAFLYPFFLPVIQTEGAIGMAHASDAPFVLSLIVGLCFIVLLLEVQGQAVSAKLVALLGVLVSINSILRFIEVAVPGPGGVSPVFFLIIVTGYVYGGRFGYLMGALTLVTSALITGGVGPWLPYQMLTAGWVGLTAPLCRLFVRWLRAEDQWAEVIVLAIFAALWGFGYGAIMNIWFWPFAIGPANQYWVPGVSLGETVQRYLAFYVATSFVWDGFGAVGNVLLVTVFGLPTLRALRRFKRRFAFDHRPYQPSPV